jgi:hypothetical protein
MEQNDPFVSSTVLVVESYEVLMPSLKTLQIAFIRFYFHLQEQRLLQCHWKCRTLVIDVDFPAHFSPITRDCIFYSPIQPFGTITAVSHLVFVPTVHKSIQNSTVVLSSGVSCFVDAYNVFVPCFAQSFAGLTVSYMSLSMMFHLYTVCSRLLVLPHTSLVLTVYYKPDISPQTKPQ